MKDKIREILGKKLDGTEKQFVETTNELFDLFSVINLREQLVAFNKEMSELHSWFLPAEDSMIDKFLRNK